ESARVLHEIAELMPRRGLVVVISDLFYDPRELLDALDHIRFMGHDILVFQILDPLERRLSLEGEVRFHDLETGQELVAQVQEMRAAYESAVSRWYDELEQTCLVRKIDRVSLTTDQPVAAALTQYLAQRSQHY